MNVNDIIKNLSKMHSYELKMVCREMNCKVSSKREMLTLLVAPLLKDKYKLPMKMITETKKVNYPVLCINKNSKSTAHPKLLKLNKNSVNKLGFTSVIKIEEAAK